MGGTGKQRVSGSLTVIWAEVLKVAPYVAIPALLTQLHNGSHAR